jgi:hypothetical protein
MSLWNNSTPPVLYPDAVATPAGWADPVTGELLVTVTGLSTYKNEGAGTQLVSARILGAKVQGSDPIVLKKTFAAGDVIVVEAMFLEPVTKTGGTPTMVVTINGNARTFTNFTDTSDFDAKTKGKITGFTISAGGSSYAAGDYLTFSGGGGSSALAQVTSVGAITAIALLDGGSGYTSAPTVGVTSVHGTGATITAKVGSLANGTGTNRWLFSYTVASNETATSAQIVFPSSVTGVFDNINDGLGTGAAGTAVIGTGVTSITVTGGGSGYTSAPDVQITDSTGTGATAVANLDKGVASVTVTAGGSNYTSAPTVGFSGGGGTLAAGTAVLATSGGIKSVTVGGSGTGYTNGDPLIFTPTSGGSGAAGHISVTTGNITGVVMTAAGSGYITAPTVTVTTSGGSGNTLTAVIGKAVASVTMTVAGSGYTSAPTVAFTSGGGTGATGTAVMENLADVLSVTVTAPGSNYTSPVVAFQNGGGTGATATAATSGVVTGVTITNGGSKYWNVPTVGFSAGSAAGTAVLDRGVVKSVTITNGGSSYVSAPTVSFTEPATTATNPTFNAVGSGAGFAVDGVAPTITGVVLSGEESGVEFVTNNIVTLTLTCSKVVYLNLSSGTPTIALTIGSGSPVATYVQGSGSNTLVFQYEIGVSDTCTATNFSVSSPVVLNGATIKDLPGNNLVLTFTPPTTSTITVNNPVLPTISSVTLVGGPAFTTSGTISLHVTCDENVYVNTSFGVPEIELFINNHGQFATYASGSGTTTLTFSYVVQSTDSATAGTFSTGSTIMFNGGNITDINSVNLTGSFTPPTTSSVTVN